MLCVGASELDEVAVVVPVRVDVRLPEVEGCAVRVRELVIEFVVVPDPEGDFDLAAEMVGVQVARAVELVEGLALCVRVEVVVRVADALDVVVFVATIVHVAVALVVELRVG